VASLSPELFLARRGRLVRSEPIKGTRPRPADPAAAERERVALEGSEKDRAENVMIVDLVRNDLGRVCEPGSVRVPAPAAVRAHAGVWHLVAAVEGHLAAGRGDPDLLRAAFPPGSVTGAPKVAALGVIAELESTGREVYTGAIGFASPFAGLELSVAIRTVEHAGGRLWLGVGGGIVADSDPSAEARETATKAAPLLAALGASLAPPAPVRPVAPPPRVGPRPLPRPDPRAGVFATMLVRAGVAVAAGRHLDRLAASLRALHGVALPAGLAARVAAAAAGAPDPGRLRVTARPGADGAEVTVETGPHPAAGPGGAAPATLSARTVPGGLGPHKWADRRLLDGLAALEPAAVVLLCDLDGLVLEAARANVVITEAGELLTPPGDGRIWAGTTRERLLAAGAVREAPFGLDRLLAADAVLLTGALRGAEPVAACDGVPLPDAAAVAARLAPLLG
jgi:para-aminobenzoate synthetase/4-amino-4-deoxychorismate lyase